MKINNRYILRAALLSAALVSFASCVSGLIFEENLCEDPVPAGPDRVLVTLKYDYNIQRADMRKDHVGWARIVALDDDNKVVAEKIVENSLDTLPLRQNDFAVEFENLAPGRYHFMATAMQRPYDILSTEPDARFRINFPSKGESISTYSARLDRVSEPDTLGALPVVAPSTGLDTLWIGFNNDRFIEVLPAEQHAGRVIRDTVSLMRDTKYLHLTLHQVDPKLKAEICDSMFHVRIVDVNGNLGYDSRLLEDDEIVYTPFAQWTTCLSEKGIAYDSEEEAAMGPEDDPIVERAAHFNLSFSRLMYYANSLEGKIVHLQIYDIRSGEVVAQINLPYYLSFGRDAAAIYNYSPQEYLDREYNYNLDFFLQHGSWRAIELRVNITGWSKRFQRESF